MTSSSEVSTIAFRAGEIAAADLAAKPLGQPSAEPLTGEIMTRAKVFLDNPTVTAGTWECEVGASRYQEKLSLAS